ncbi:hypothetical protein A6R68_03366 [Neotoma lepida]|uniref:Protein ripply2 n=1 Tax=Neotoma lepida TaxID=56216 RepID=A0A1A6GRV8_NEOLE|nr:hypothetical protein A6R68_03366 [Neotoma lepida]
MRCLRLPSCRSEGFWRPWLRTPGEKEERAEPHTAEALPSGPGVTEASGKHSQYRHPVRLFWPKSKCYDYLYQEAETLLKNFPIQATISFYEDSDSEDEIEGLAYVAYQGRGVLGEQGSSRTYPRTRSAPELRNSFTH